MNIKSWLFTLILIALILIAVFQVKLNLLFPAEVEQGPQYEPVSTIEAIDVQLTAFQNTVQVNGEIKAVQEVSLKNQLSGQITKLALVAGSVVKKGDILVTQDIASEQANLLAAKAKRVLAEQTFARYQKLADSKEISEELVDRAKADVAIAKSEVMQLESVIDKKVIRAPFDAYVGIHNLSEGQYLDGNTTLVDLIGLNEFIWLEFALPQNYEEVSVGSKVQISTIDGKQSVPAEVIAINPILAAQTRHLVYRAKVSLAQLSLKPHTLVKVTVPVKQIEQRIVIPDLALTQDHLGEYVFILTAESDNFYRAKRTAVNVWQKSQNKVVLSSGLVEGDKIATTGAFKLRDGAKVTINSIAKGEK
ncbi:efflux RND transporter periplasmic adaptor subunit [Thalassotalea sp. PLHSN55]|uniref:efflux RND transporter periplasmic adaptor subunit n=1 Tax=Thalassotalea sp. PLHSN55 TaxID=3435888 RepID=UPI003F86B798